MKRVLLTVAYDGGDFKGWQKQDGTELRTVEGEFEKSLYKIFPGQKLNMIGASRTDRGVHSLGQRVTIDVETTMPTERIPAAVRPHLPEDILVTKAEDVPPNFHPRHRCTQKVYEYLIWNGAIKDPRKRLHAAFNNSARPFDVEKMREGAKAFIGTHDFSAFRAVGSSSLGTVRTVFDCQVQTEGDYIRILVSGDGFLYNMVRIMAGTLMYVGQGKIPPPRVAQIIESKNRELAGPTAEPQALTLLEIYYDFEGKPVDRRR